jgi:quercetin dioxygenase-like cupin family protein
MNEDSDTSSRTPPKERFAPDVAHFNLVVTARELALEAHEGQHGHRQIALYKHGHGHATVALFRFKQGGGMAEHSAPGTVFVQVLEGRLVLRAQGENHVVSQGELLVLAPGMPHDVRAEEDSVMLLTVCLDRAT